jgi:hypothetical protein
MINYWAIHRLTNSLRFEIRADNKVQAMAKLEDRLNELEHDNHDILLPIAQSFEIIEAES